MNYLAHLYLSKENSNIKIGNFIADQIEGNKFKHFSKEIQQGILLHRQIDTFTDAHPIVRKSKRRLHQRYKHYDGVIVDVLYDHFLAKNWQQYHTIPLKEYAQEFYDLLEENSANLPIKTQQLLPYLKTQNWLLSYASLHGIETVLKGINKRTQGKSKMDLAINDLKEQYQEFETDFTTFFKDLIIFTDNKLQELHQK